MKNITNIRAAHEATELAYDFSRKALRAFSSIPTRTKLSDLLMAVHLQVQPRLIYGIESMKLLDHPHETVTIIAESSHTAGPPHKEMIAELTTFMTTNIGTDLTTDEIAERRKNALHRMEEIRDRINHPLSYFSSLVPGLNKLYQKQRNKLRNEVLDTLENTPLPNKLFDEVAQSVLYSSGFSYDDMPEIESLKSLAAENHAQFLDHWETILMLCWEAGSSEDEGIDQEVRRGRFAKAKKRARQKEEQKESERKEQIKKFEEKKRLEKEFR